MPVDLAALADVETARVPLHDVLGGDVAVELAERRREQALGVELGDDRERLVDRQLARRDAQRVLERERGAEPLDVALVVEEKEVAVLVKLDAVHRLELVERPQRDPDVQLVGELRPEAAGRLARRPGSEHVPLDEHDVVDTEPAEVPGDARPHGASADDNHFGRVAHGRILSCPRR